MQTTTAVSLTACLYGSGLRISELWDVMSYCSCGLAARYATVIRSVICRSV